MNSKTNLTFPHHTLEPDEVTGSVSHLDPLVYQQLSDNLRHNVERLQDRSIKRVIFLHGTFVGNDAAGIARRIGTRLPVAGYQLRRFIKRGVDQVSGEHGNFTASYIDQVNRLLQPSAAATQRDEIYAEKFDWSGENNHLGRLLAATQLINHLADLKKSMSPNDRILMVGHSHGGNVLAMLSLLHHAERDMVAAFFQQLSALTEDIRQMSDNRDIWSGANALLLKEDALPQYDIITMGTPLRYRWPTNRTHELIHLINHQVHDTHRPSQAWVPIQLPDLRGRIGGDLIQQIGIGGSYFTPSLFSAGERRLNRKLGTIFEPTVRRRHYLRKLSRGRRESSDGRTFLVDYHELLPNQSDILLGHGVYTLQDLIPLHLAIAATELGANLR